MPRFDRSPESGRREQDWLIFDLNLDYIRATMLPELLDRYLGQSGHLHYNAEVTVTGAPSQVIYRSGPRIGGSADSSVMLLDAGPNSFSGGPPEPGPRGGPPSGPNGGMRGGPRRPPSPWPMASRTWVLSVRHEAGSLEALVGQTRARNLAISCGLLVLIVATVVMLVRFSRQAQRLAELQINFVAGISHELRTPLTVIRTAAFNLRGRLANRPEQVERYGALIQDETEKLNALVEQVLRFASSQAGVTIHAREPVRIEDVIEKSLAAAAREKGVVIEKQIAPDLPLVLGDELALRHALQNLVDNAWKYGSEGGGWIGVRALAVSQGGTPYVEIRVADHGPGIPREEQARIFDPFYRGGRALRDQVHGTGLGLHLVRKIVEAHGGRVSVKSTPGELTEFVVRIPAEQPVAHTALAGTPSA
jgi:signal transduction histidine kinase